MSKHSREGFTLVELLVVISIIAVLLSILMPALSKVRGQGRKVVCASNLRQISLAFATYAQSNNDWIVSATDIRVDGVWNFALLPYVAQKQTGGFDSAKVWFCPEDKNPFPIGLPAYYHGVPLTSYAENGLRIINGPAGSLRLGPAGGYKTIQIRNPSSVMLLIETSYWGQVYDWDSPAIQRYGGIITDGHHRRTSGFYHSNSMNILHVDTHIASIKGKTAPAYTRGITQNFLAQNMFYPTLSLPSSSENPQLWGPGYY
ncbi:MAG: type II secretion system protein [Phycisphaerae bacterium]|jgi:prepilin-type N-terminal cleavage/methylation domain-containing protein/prepilin-type processing-associated H-X9-DG protein